MYITLIYNVLPLLAYDTSDVNAMMSSIEKTVIFTV